MKIQKNKAVKILKYVITAALILGVFQVILSGQNNVIEPTGDVTTDWWENNVKAINPEAENFEDLQFLKKEIGDRRIVALGEQTHEDGATFEARGRLVEFLMEEMGFEVVLFEGGIFDLEVGNQVAQETKSVDSLTQYLYDFWSDAAQHKALFGYFDTRLKNGDPTYFGGFDCKHTSKAGIRGTNYTDALIAAIQTHNADILTHDNFESYLSIWKHFEEKRASGHVAKIRIKMKDEEKENLRTLSKWLQTELEAADASFWQQIVHTTDESMIAYSDMRLYKLVFGVKSFVPINNRRDELMAENLTYLLEEKYADKKVILIGATYHFVRNNDLLMNSKIKGLHINESTITGDLIHPTFKDEIYTIGFTAYDGYYGMVEGDKSGDEIDAPTHSNSVEHQLNSRNYEQAFLPLNTTKNDAFWSNYPSLRLYDYETDLQSNDWSEIVDAVFFIRTMEPIYAVE
jgi:erythromycin esterase